MGSKFLKYKMIVGSQDEIVTLKNGGIYYLDLFSLFLKPFHS